MAEGGRDPEMPYIPDCIESADEETAPAVFDLHDMWQGLPGRPERQRRRHHAERQIRESRERHAREQEERRGRRAAARITPSGDDDLRLPAPAGQVSSTDNPQRKVACVAPFIKEPRRPLDRTAGRGAILLNLLHQPLRPPPHIWNHGDGRSAGDLGPQDFFTDPN